MDGKNVFYQMCCCSCGEQEPEEKTPIISETLLYFGREAKRRRAEEANLWSEPQDTSHTERDDDRELYNLLQKRAKTRRGSQGYRRLSFDIHSVRQVRRDVLGKWKMILEVLGFHKEADSLLTVTSTTSYNNLRNPTEAKHLLELLSQDTSIFDNKMPAERYIFVLDRLIILDIAQDFMMKAKNYYPRELGQESEIDSEDTGAILLRKKNEIDSVTDEEPEEIDEDILLARSLD
ncbi:melanoregulin [Callorhinchus milii]|nr:melanoregulin [Callorhinchus milii]|eukprot:gi/632966835/ref/XP_007899638.1/ PREDICTED: melanoregulin-like [Callorhinchus milii]